MFFTTQKQKQMKRLYTTLTLISLGTLLGFSQADTLLFENFQEDNSALWGLYPEGNDTIWIAYDEDQQPVNGGVVAQQNWFRDLIFEDTASTDYGLISLSYMQDINVLNRNWFITPPVPIYDDAAVLHWSSAPYQLPRYMDGYKVLVSTTTNDLESFTDTIFVAAEMTDIVGDGQSLELSNFLFSEGYFHANNLTDTNYFEVASDMTLCYGLLEPHSVSLAQYAGKTIYIAFLHDSFDDYYFEIDDILLTGSLVSGTANTKATDYRFLTYPNPVRWQMNVLYRLPAPAEVSLQIVDSQGKVVQNVLAEKDQAAGDHQLQLNLQDLPSGTYFTNLLVDGKSIAKPFIKR